MLSDYEFFIYIKDHSIKVLQAVFLLKGSAWVIESPRIEYKGFKYRYKIKDDIHRCWLSRTKLVKIIFWF